MTLRSVDSFNHANPTGDWLTLSAQFTWLTELLGERRDLTVAVAQGAGWGAPAAFLFPSATVEMDAKYWPKGFPPAQAKAEDGRDWTNYPGFIGMLMHEVAHANHSMWMYNLNKVVQSGGRVLTGDEKHGVGSAKLLEELRIEHKHLLERAQDAPFLTTMAMTISMAEALTAKALPSKAAASRTALLVLGRIDAGDMPDNKQTQHVRDLAVATLGQSLMSKLEKIWKEFLTCDDTDTDRILDLGVQWWKLTQDDPDDKQDQGDDGGMSQDLRDALDDLAKEILKEMGDADGIKKMLDKLADAINEAEKEFAAQKQSKKDARNVFGGGSAKPGGAYDPFKGWKEPNLDERGLARRTATQILEAYMREKTLMPHDAVMPPGRLRARAAMTRDAQKAMGMYPTAAPFRTVTRKANPSPPLDVGIVLDTSGSQGGWIGTTASATYSLAQATKIIPDGRVALVTFGDRPRPILGPGDKLQGVPHLSAGGGTGYFKQAVRSIDGEMNFARKGAARLLVCITDGQIDASDLEGRDDMLNRLLKNGAHILWVQAGRAGHIDTEVGKNGQFGGHWVIPVIKHPRFRVVRPAMNELPRVLCEEAVRVLEAT